MDLRIGVKILLKNEKGKFLLVKRSIERYATIAIRGSWDIVGGRIDPGTSLLENLKREVKEETGLEVISEPKPMYVQDIIYKDGVQNKYVVRISYLGQTKGEPILDKSECVDYKWLTLNELKENEDTDIYLKEIIDKGLVELMDNHS